MVAKRTLEDRFWSKVAIGGWDECWPWTGTTNGRKGYGMFWVGPSRLPARRKLAHRQAYELLIGPIPEGLTIDHVAEWGCTTKLCCNPLHLEAVTMQENNRRAFEKTHCLRGHRYTPETTYDPPNGSGRQCLPCKRIRRERARVCAG